MSYILQIFFTLVKNLFHDLFSGKHHWTSLKAVIRGRSMYSRCSWVSIYSVQRFARKVCINCPLEFAYPIRIVAAVVDCAVVNLLYGEFAIFESHCRRGDTEIQPHICHSVIMVCVETVVELLPLSTIFAPSLLCQCTEMRESLIFYKICRFVASLREEYLAPCCGLESLSHRRKWHYR